MEKGYLKKAKAVMLKYLRPKEAKAEVTELQTDPEVASRDLHSVVFRAI